MQIQGTAAIVTGGASGLGAATAQMLAARGAKVTIFDRDGEGAAKHAEAIGAFCRVVDIIDETSVNDALSAAEAAHGVARILVNCAGIAPVAKTVARDNAPHALDVFRRVLDVNVSAAFSVLSKFAARIAAAGGDQEECGVIVNTASVAAFDGQIGQAAYAASKAAVVGMTLPLARDLSALRIRVMTIAPGIFLTPMLLGLPQAAQDSLAKQIPHPMRLGKPGEFAALVESIVTNPMLNGEVIRLDGAIRMGPR